MRSTGFQPTSGRSGGRSALAVLALLLLVPACNYGFRGGGGLPDRIQTVYIEPFENETVQFGLEQQLMAELAEELPGRLGLRPAGRSVADAVVRGRVVRYSDAAQNYRSDGTGGTPRSAEVISHQVRIGVAIEILDVEENLILWEHRGINGQGSYQPASQSDEIARQDAIEDLVRQIIDGTQSQW